MTDLPDPDRFTDSPIDRRTFLCLSAATGAALALPGNATATVSSPKFTTEYEYVLTHTPDDYAVPTLVEFSDAAGLDAFTDAFDDAITTTEVGPAAYAELTTAEAKRAVRIPTAETFTHAPGANPFWRLGYYPLDVFPSPYRSTDYIVYEEMVAGMQHLEAEHSDRLNFYSIGQSPGHYNRLSDRNDPKDIWVAEVTNDVNDDAAFAEKEKVMYSLSIHGNERAGAEAGTRFVENLLAGRERETEQLLDDVVLVLVFPNPDGWVARHPQYQGRFERGNAGVGDTNRQFPITGWIDPSHYPAEPKGANAQDDDPGIDSDVPAAMLQKVPDALSLVEHFRDYENLNYGADFHGMSVADNFVLGLISQDQFDHEALHELYEMNRVIDENLEATLDPSPYASEAYDYSTIWDTLGYTDSGFFGDWMAHPKPLGGLGLTSMDFEMTLSNFVGQNFYSPHLMEKQVVCYGEAIRTLASFAVQNSDTPTTNDQFAADIETDGNATAYVTTDALTRSSDQLEFVAPDDGNGGSGTLPVQTASESVAVTDEATTTTDVPADTHTLSVSLSSVDSQRVSITLRDPVGEVVREVRATTLLAGDGQTLVVRGPNVGEWTLTLANADDAAATVDVTTATVAGDPTKTPDPEAVLGYSQFDYKVSPFVFFDDQFIPEDDPLRANEIARDYDDVTDAPIDPLSVADVVAGDAADYENLVVIHDDGIENGDYVDALDEFVEGGGNLVCTDTGVHLLGAMDASLASPISPDNVVDDTFYVANLGTKTSDHPLLEGTRPIQNQLWKIAGLGYSTGTEAPMTLVDQSAFDEAGGRAAGVNDSRVTAGSLLAPGASGTTRDVVESNAGSIHVIGGLLPPAFQENLHPFGLLDYSTSFLGHTMLTNALGYVQKRYVGGETVETFGGEAEFSANDGGSGGGPSPTGSRTDDGRVFMANEKNKVELTVSADQSVQVRDTIPLDWKVVTPNNTIERVERDPNAGVKRLYFNPDAPTTDLDTYYIAEAPSAVGTEVRTGQYEFGPVEASTDGESWVAVAGTTDTNIVVARDSQVLDEVTADD